MTQSEQESHHSQKESQNEQEPVNQKIESQNLKESQRKKRRKKVDGDGRDYTCHCGKSYLSYPALYTHVKTKHNGQVSVIEKQQIPLGHNNPMYSSRQNLHSYKRQFTPNKQQNSEDSLAIEKMKEFILKHLIKDKSRQSLMDLRASLALKQEELGYINQILREADCGEGIKVQDASENKQFPLSNSKSQQQSQVQINKQDQGQLMCSLLQASSELKKHDKINLLRNIIQQQNKAISKPQKKGFILGMFPIPQLSQKKSTRNSTYTVDQVMGAFLSEFLKSGYNNELVSMVMVYFICRVKNYYGETKNSESEEKSGQSLVDESSQIVSFLTQMDNPYLRQPVAVCKLLFFFYRWMFKRQFTAKYVKFNQAG